MADLKLEGMVAEQVKKTPGAVAIIYDGDVENGCVKITYHEMWQRATQVSSFILKHSTMFGAFTRIS